LIRLATPEDAPGILEIYAPIVRETPVAFEVEAPAPDGMSARITKVLEKYPWLVDIREGRIAGYVYAGLHRDRPAYQWSTDLSVYVHPDWRGKGVGRGLYGALFDVLVFQGYVNAFAGITLPNLASVKLHESVGFRPIGVFRNVGFKLGSWHDVGKWQRELQPLPPAPPPPLPRVRVEIEDRLRRRWACEP
jgi:phosphinothricin acetyltransferase